MNKLNSLKHVQHFSAHNYTVIKRKKRKKRTEKVFSLHLFEN